jgi:hypothetical protein
LWIWTTTRQAADAVAPIACRGFAELGDTELPEGRDRAYQMPILVLFDKGHFKLEIKGPQPRGLTIDLAAHHRGYYVGPKSRDGLIFGYGAADIPALEQGLTRLREALRRGS